MASLALLLFGPTRPRHQTDWSLSLAGYRFGLTGDHQSTAFHCLTHGPRPHPTFHYSIGFSDTVHYLGLLFGFAVVLLLLLCHFARGVDDIADSHAAAATKAVEPTGAATIRR